jgi:pimeloyl-ACP methyl ester carboxylesterase
VVVEERDIEVAGLPIRYLSAGTGPPLVLLHGAGDNALDWRWVMPALATTHRVYAPDLPGSPDSARPSADYSPAFFERFVANFLDALDVERAVLAGNSLGGLMALRLALSQPTRVAALILVDSAGLGRAVNPAFTAVNVPGLSEAMIPLWRTPIGAYQRAWGRAALLFARPGRVPVSGWLNSAGWRSHLAIWKPTWPRCAPRLAQEASARLVDRLSRLRMPTHIVWGARDRVFPESQARDAAARLKDGSLAVIPDCGHLPHVECPGRFVAELERFLGERLHR